MLSAEKVVHSSSESSEQVILDLLSKKLDLSQEGAAHLLKVAQLKTLRRQELLFREGDPSHTFYLIVRGQLKGTRARPDGQVDFTLSFYPGEMIGELGFFDHSSRTLTISARRESLLLEISEQSLAEMGKFSISVYQHLIRLLVSRFKQTMGYGGKTNPHLFIYAESFIEPQFLNDNVYQPLMNTLGRVAHLRRHRSIADISEHTPSTDGAVAVELIEPIQGHPSVLDDRLLDELDTVCLLLSEQSLKHPELLSLIRSRLVQINDDIPIVVVLIHPGNRVDASLTACLQDALGNAIRPLHVRLGYDIDFLRLCRHLTGQTLGLVLGGGGARGFAHAGFYQALEESGVYVDSVGGTSMGALVGALIASGLSAASVQKALAISFKKGLPFKLTDYWIPKYGFVKGKAADGVYKSAFGDLRIENQPIPYFAVSCSLTSGGQFLFEQGPVWQAVRASTSIPVFFEPFLHGDDVMVDGAMVNNLPVDVMRGKGIKRVVAVDVGMEEDITVQVQAGGKAQLPSMMKSLMRVIELGGIEKARKARHLTDQYIQPDIEAIGLMEFERREEIVQIGYEAGKRAIPDILSLAN